MTEPEIDEVRFADAQRVVRISALRGQPLDDDRCGACLYYLTPGDALAFCWHEKLQVLVGESWWCHFWEMREGE